MVTTTIIYEFKSSPNEVHEYTSPLPPTTSTLELICEFFEHLARTHDLLYPMDDHVYVVDVLNDPTVKEREREHALRITHGCEYDEDYAY